MRNSLMSVCVCPSFVCLKSNFLFFSDSGYLSCSFDDGLCGWIRDKDGDLHWETTPDPTGKCNAKFWFIHYYKYIPSVIPYPLSLI